MIYFKLDNGPTTQDKQGYANMKNICAIVVTYNRCELLAECLNALLNSEIVPNIIVVDNHSTDNTRSVVETIAQGGGVEYFDTGKNLGGAGGFQFGLKKAYELGYEYFWLMDDDTIVQKDSLAKLLDSAKRHNDSYGFLSSLALWKDGSVCNMNYHMADRMWNESKKSLQYGEIQIVAATFVSFFTRRQVVEEMGLPIAEYFIWGDDTEYALRISRKYPCWFVSSSQVVHKMKSNAGTEKLSQITDADRIKRMYYSYRNDCCTYKRRGAKEFVKFCIGRFKDLVDVAFSPCSHKGQRLGVLLKGCLAGLFFSPKIQYVNNR